ncbi:hypothetical protein BHE74_00040361 [Ensete ventricosum]|nr:hypothetical protein BHE74_00040361 [Ensete ventricosum]
MATTYEGTLRVDVEIELNGGLTRGMVGMRATINSMQIERQSKLGWNLVKYPSRMKGVDVEDGNMERKHGAFLGQSDWRVGLPQCLYSLKGVWQVKGQGQRWDFHGVIDPLLSWRESVGHKRGREGAECRGKLQVPRQGRRAKAKELHKTGVDGLPIKIAESEGLRVNA